MPLNSSEKQTIEDQVDTLILSIERALEKSLENPHIFTLQAQYSKKMLECFLTEGFSREEAIKLICASLRK